MAIGDKLREEAKRKRERDKKARQRARKKTGVFQDITIRIYDQETLREILGNTEYAHGIIKVNICGGATDLLKLSLDIAVERWLDVLCRTYRLDKLWGQELHSGAIEPGDFDKKE